MRKDPRSQTNAIAPILQDDADSLNWSSSFRVGETREAIEVAGGFMTTIRVGAEQFRRQLTDLLNRVSYGGDEVIVERNGRPLVILKQYEEVDQVTELSQNQIERTLTLAKELETARLNAGISYEELARAANGTTAYFA